MSEKWSFAKKIGKGLCAFVLAVGTVISIIPSASIKVQAAQYFTFYDKNKNEDPNIPIVAGSSTTILADLPRGFNLSFPSFTITRGRDGTGESVASGQGQMFYVGTQQPFQGNRKQMELRIGTNAGYLDSGGIILSTPPEYSLNANMSATNQNEGEVYIQPDGDNKFAATVTTADLGLTMTSGISFRVDENGKAGKATGTGWFEPYYSGGDVILTKTSDTELHATVLANPAHSSMQSLKFTITLAQANAESIKDKGYSVEMMFYRPTSSPLVVTVYSPEYAITELETGISADPSGYLNGDGKSTIIQLAPGDSFDKKPITGDADDISGGGGITKAITVLREIQFANAIFTVDWSWESPGNESVLTFNESNQFIVSRKLKSVRGELVGKIKYTPLYTGGGPAGPFEGEVRIPTTVIGEGEPPKVSFKEQIVGTYDPTIQGAKDVATPFNTSQPMKMDVYNGGVNPDIYEPQPVLPYKYTGSIDYGEYLGMASRVIIKMEKIGQSDGRVQLSLPGREIQDYSFGTPINNTSTDRSRTIDQFTIRAMNPGDIRLIFEFYDSAGTLIGKQSDYSFLINITDSSPTSDPSLVSLVMTAEAEEETEAFDKNFPNGIVNFGFTSDEITYGTDASPIQLPYLVKNITFTPSYTIIKNNNDIVMSVDGVQKAPIKSGQNTETIDLTIGKVYTIAFDCLAENGDPMRYTLKVMRMQKSSNASLDELIVKPEKNSPEEEFFELSPQFDPERFGDTLAYEVHVPYGQKSVNVKAVAKDAWASKVEITANPQISTRSLMGRIAALFKPNADETINLRYDDGSTAKGYNLTIVTVTVTPEEGDARKYIINIYRNDPSEDATIKEPTVSYWLRGTSRPKDERALALDAYDPTENDIFTERVEYSTDRVKVIITPNDYLATKVTVTLPDGTLKEEDHKAVAREPQPLTFVFDNVNGLFNQNNILSLKVTVNPEKPNVVGKPYFIHIEREPPNRDTTAKVTLTNMLTNEAIDFGYTDVIDSYQTTEIKYTPGDMRVLVKVEPNSETTTVTVNGETPRPDGTAIQLTTGSTTTVTIVLTAEDGSTRTITIPLKYKGPSNAAYLSNLTAGGLKFLPDPTPFDKKKTSYKIEIPKGTTTLPVTATLLKDGSKDDSSNATITIEGVTVKDGEAFNYQPTDKTGKITIVVTAQDGKTKRTYTITFKNWNLLIPNDEDTLKDLWVDYGDMQPEFSPAVTEYDVYVKPDAMDLKIYPKLKDKDGDIEVTAESKVLTQFEDYYSTSLMDDEMDIHIYVWSEKAVVESASSNTNTDAANTKPARSAAREYILHVYRNDEEKIGSLKPVTADMVDFTSADPIVIDITKYTVISAEVFNTLKTDYADKSIIFKGNDYTLQVFGADIDGLVPNAESFDLKFSFRTPDEDKILDIIDDSGRNGDIEPVYYYFNQHGALPGEMLLTVDLGRHYRNTELYWNYYNKERERIDYYGYVHTNAKGTFSVPISHFSTYLSTEDKIRGAENKSDEYGNPLLTPETENLNAPRSADKAIPNTGAGVTG